MSQTAKRCAVVAVLAIAALLPQFETLKISSGGLQLLADAEGCRTSPYQCSAGVWTNGIGHTAGVTPQSAVSERQAAVNLVDDLIRVERQLSLRAGGDAAAGLGRAGELRLQRRRRRRLPLDPGQLSQSAALARGVRPAAALDLR